MQDSIVTTDTPKGALPPHLLDQTIHTLSVYVANKPGVLARIAATFARRGYNIESLVVSPAMDGRFSRMTIGVSGRGDGLRHIIAAANKLVDVLHCNDHTFDQAVVKELALIKVRVEPADRGEALQIGEHFGCKTVDLTERSMILQCTGDSSKIDALVGMVNKWEIIELVRTGKVAMLRGEETT